ncbi:diaminopropionate ammonia-lyase [Curvivirga sp.]|uniref:diaminopropionate ammonia-lyase n=1 Tax=Curvivirga sp. TaxID=2856848 RepID=UPI003B5C7985
MTLDAYKNATLNHHKNTSYDEGVYPSSLDSVLSAKTIEDAYTTISSWKGYEATPLYHLHNLASEAGVADILYKHEGGRFGLGSFKALGGAYAVLRLLAEEVSKRTGKDVSIADIQGGSYAKEVSEVTIVTATDGNHGRSVAWGSQSFGARCFIYMHAGVSKGRAKAVEDLGATVIWVDGNYDESVRQAAQDAEDNGWFVVSDTSYEGYVNPPRNVMAGYTVMTNEIKEQLGGAPAPTHVFLQGGVGGLAGAMCTHLWQIFGENKPRFVIVEPDRADCLYQSGIKGEAVDVHITEETIMAGLSCGEVSNLGWEILKSGTADFLTISDDIVAPTMKLLANGSGDDVSFAAGESAVAGLAGALAALQNEGIKEALGLDENSRILVFGTEGATDPAIYEELVGVAADSLAA